MAMTLRLSEEDTAALRTYANAAGRSMHEVVQEAIRDYLDERAKRRDEILARIVHEDAELLDLLSK
jgi:predicted transcriptional regulator